MIDFIKAEIERTNKIPKIKKVTSRSPKLRPVGINPQHPRLWSTMTANKST